MALIIRNWFKELGKERLDNSFMARKLLSSLCELLGSAPNGGFSRRQLTMADSMPTDWKKEHLPQELLDLRTHLESLPLHLRAKMVPLCDRVCHFTRLQSRLVQIAQDTVDQLHLDVKYLLFDLDITRRERDSLRQELEEQSGDF